MYDNIRTGEGSGPPIKAEPISAAEEEGTAIFGGIA